MISTTALDDMVDCSANVGRTQKGEENSQSYQWHGSSDSGPEPRHHHQQQRQQQRQRQRQRLDQVHYHQAVLATSASPASSSGSSSRSSRSENSSNTVDHDDPSSINVTTSTKRRSKLRRATTTVYGPHPKHPYPQWHNAVAGGVAGAGARLATAPLDLVRIRRQLERNVTYPRPSLYKSLKQIYHDEGGLQALFRGNMAATYLWIGYSMVQFAVYSRLKHYLEGKDHPRNSSPSSSSSSNNTLLSLLPVPHPTISSNPTAVAFLAGAGAGLCATVSTYPFDIVRTVLAARGGIIGAGASGGGSSSAIMTTPPKSLIECATVMYQQRGGISSFFAGIKPAVVQIIPYMGMNFAIYDHLTTRNGHDGNHRSVSLSAYAGSISGGISKIVVYPMDTVKKRLQAQSVFGPQINSCGRYYTGLWHCLTTMIQKEGLISVYRGIIPSVMKTTIGSGLSFSFFRMAKNGLEEIHDYVHYEPPPPTTTASSSSSSSSRPLR